MCDEVERWISQDHVGLNSRVTILQNWDAPFDARLDPFVYKDHLYNEFIDRCANREENVNAVKPDPELAKNTWNAVLEFNLPKKSLEFAELYYHQGKSLAKTAAALKISAQAANDRHKKLKRDIKDRLERIEIWEEIKDQYLGLDEPTRGDMVIMLFYGLFYSRKQIAERTGMAYNYVSAILQKFTI